jgi:Uma2 family endonuclease
VEPLTTEGVAMDNLAYKVEIDYEIHDGKPVAMSPRPLVNHNSVLLNISRVFGNYLKGKKCVPFSDGVDLYLTDKDRFIPDMMVVCNRDIIKKNGVYGAPDLVVEVLSTRTRKHDKGYKKDVYECCGVREYWIVEIESRTVEVYLLEDGRFQLDYIYTVIPDDELALMEEEERNAIRTQIKPSLYDELLIPVEEVFSNVFVWPVS